MSGRLLAAIGLPAPSSWPLGRWSLVFSADMCVKTPSDLGGPWGARSAVLAHIGGVSHHPSTTRGTVADAAATLAVLVVGASLLAMTAPLVSALAVVLTLALYVPVRVAAG